MTTPNDGQPTYDAAWYPDANIPGTERWYDGNAWTEHTRPIESITAPTEVYSQANTSASVAAPAANLHSAPVLNSSASAPVEPGTTTMLKRPWFKRKAIVIPVGIVAGLIVISGISGALGGDKQNDSVVASDDKKTAEAVADEPIEEVETETEMVAVPTALVGMTAADAAAALTAAGFKPSFDGDGAWKVLSIAPADAELEKGAKVVLTLEQPPAMTLGQKNAVDSAQSYLRFSAFSRAGLAQQLTSQYGEGYDPADADFALAYLEQNGLVDWDAEAAESAKSYLDMTSFSRDGLYDQLTSEHGEQFTPEQANAGLAAVGY